MTSLELELPPRAQPSVPSTRHVMPSLLAPAAAIAGIAATAVASLPTICPFRVCTGHACPGCGLTRGVAAAIKGDLGLSIRYHPLALIVAAQVIFAWAVYLRVGAARWNAMVQRALPLVVLNVVLLLATWALRWRWGLLDFVVA